MSDCRTRELQRQLQDKQARIEVLEEKERAGEERFFEVQRQLREKDNALQAALQQVSRSTDDLTSVQKDWRKVLATRPHSLLPDVIMATRHLLLLGRSSTTHSLTPQQALAAKEMQTRELRQQLALLTSDEEGRASESQVLCPPYPSSPPSPSSRQT